MVCVCTSSTACTQPISEQTSAECWRKFWGGGPTFPGMTMDMKEAVACGGSGVSRGGAVS